MLLAARLSHPLALVNVPRWAEESGAEYLWGIPAEKLNDDRLGRSLDALFTQRHSVLAADDGYSVLLTTASLTHSADTLFTEFKQQCYVEQGHHQWKTPLAVRPLFLKSPASLSAQNEIPTKTLLPRSQGCGK